MFATVLLLLLILITVGASAAAVVSRRLRLAAAGAAGIALIFALIVGIFSSYDRVDTRNVGIITQFGRPVGEHGAGIVWHAPWQSVSELSEAIQLQAFESSGFDDAKSGKGIDKNPPAINVRLANNSEAYVDANVNWRLREGAAPQLFQDYGGSSTDVFTKIREQLVDRQLQVALSHEFATFNPQTLLTAAGQQAPGQPASVVPTPAQGANLPAMATHVKNDLQSAVGNDIEILDVKIPHIFYDSSTQQKIDAYNQNVQDTINAQQRVQTAIQERLAAEARAAQQPPDLRIAVFNCINSMVQNQKDPAGCWGQIGGQPLIQLPKP